MPFAGLRVLSLESRRAQEMETLIRRMGGDPFVAPSVQERPLEDHTEAIHFVESLEAGEFNLVICMTGVGLEFLRDAAAAHMPLERFAAALRRAAIIARGPKPVPALRAMNVPVAVVIQEPNTWKEIVDVVATRGERRVAVQEYGRPNLELNAALKSLGAKVTPVAIYRWELPADLEPLRKAAAKIAARECDVALFTSSIQFDHLLEVACQEGIEEEVRRALTEHIAVASVGPVMTSTLEVHGIPPDIVPQHPKMWALVKAASELSARVLEQKRCEGPRTRKSAKSLSPLPPVSN